MGQELNTKIDVQKKGLKNIIINALKTSESIMIFHKTLTKDQKSLDTINKSIKQSRRAIKVISQVEHIEILNSLYNTLILGKESYFALFGALITTKNTVARWDKTKSGFKTFLKLEAEAKAKSKEDYEERLKQQELIQTARKQGKKVEMIYKDGKLQPLIVEDKQN